MKRRNTNKYERNRYHQMRNNMLMRRFSDSYHDRSKLRAEERRELHCTSYDEDWDVCVKPDRWGRWGNSGGGVRWPTYRNQPDPKTQISINELHRLPQWAQHKWHQALAWENNYNYCNFKRPKTNPVYDFDKVLQALTIACKDPEKLWILERYEKEYIFFGDYKTVIEKIVIPLNDIEDWLFVQWQSRWGYVFDGKKYDEDGNYLYTINHRRIDGICFYLCETLRDLGYDVYKEE